MQPNLLHYRDFPEERDSPWPGGTTLPRGLTGTFSAQNHTLCASLLTSHGCNCSIPTWALPELRGFSQNHPFPVPSHPLSLTKRLQAAAGQNLRAAPAVLITPPAQQPGEVPLAGQSPTCSLSPPKSQHPTFLHPKRPHQGACKTPGLLHGLSSSLSRYLPRDRGDPTPRTISTLRNSACTLWEAYKQPKGSQISAPTPPADTNSPPIPTPNSL